MYLNSFIEPSVGRVELAAASVEHLQGAVRVVAAFGRFGGGGGDGGGGGGIDAGWILAPVEIFYGQRLVDTNDHATRLDPVQRTRVNFV